MVSATFFTNLLLASAALAAPSLEARLKRGLTGRQSNTTQYLEARDAGLYAADPTRVGAIQRTSAGAVTAVTCLFTVPTLYGSGSVSVWIGIDAYTYQNNYFHTGVDFTISNGKLSSNAWYEWYPYTLKHFTGISFQEGNVVRLIITTTSSSTGTAIIENFSSGQIAGSPDIQSPYPLSQQDAEWFVQGDDYIPDFGTLILADAVATTNNGNIGPDGSNAVIMDIVRGGQFMAFASVNSSSVNITYGQ